MYYGQDEERVMRGAEFLDEHYPGWENKVDPVRLNIGDPCNCVLGQLGIAEGYKTSPFHSLMQVHRDAITAYDVRGRDGRWIPGLATLGFAGPNYYRWKPLNDAWKTFIQGRREQSKIEVREPEAALVP